MQGGESECGNSVDSDGEDLMATLCGLSSATMSSTDWKEDDNSLESQSQQNSQQAQQGNQWCSCGEKVRIHNMHATSSGNHENVFSRAFQASSDGKFFKPPVLIIDLSSEDKGNILVATRTIQKGEVIFTERALEAAQVPFGRCIRCSSSQGDQMYTVRGCQHCFRSLEPASSLLGKGHTGSGRIPLSELWPVTEYVDLHVNESECTNCAATRERGKLWTDKKSKRTTCGDCGAIFCTHNCAKSHMNTMGSCCLCTNAIKGVIHAMLCESSGDGCDDFQTDIDPVLILATRMFCATVQRYRNGDPTNLFDGLCGDPFDINALRLGSQDRRTGHYSLEREYKALIDVLELTESECAKPLSLKTFQKTGAMAQRNAISLMTRSPFQSYYQAILRNTGSRGSPGHKQVMCELACTLGSKDGTLSRDMDRIIEEKCAVKIGGIFTLAAKMNHSCDPCVEIRGKEYIDCNIDIVARRNIHRGEELSISYVYLGAHPSNSTVAKNRRRRELEGRYLFICNCTRCV